MATSNKSGSRAKPDHPACSALMGLQDGTRFYVAKGSHLHPSRRSVEDYPAGLRCDKHEVPPGWGAVFSSSLLHHGAGRKAGEHSNGRLHMFVVGKGCTPPESGKIKQLRGAVLPGK